jgi:hypothetical protein
MLVLTASGCAVRTGADIDGYRSGACISPLAEHRRIGGPTREWEHTIERQGKPVAKVAGYQAVGGHIEVTDLSTGQQHTAVPSADYIYPADVRVNCDSTRLFVKSTGLAAGLWHQTWLYEYDLVSFKSVARTKVVPEVLPSECLGPQDAGRTRCRPGH